MGFFIDEHKKGQNSDIFIKVSHTQFPFIKTHFNTVISCPFVEVHLSLMQFPPHLVTQQVVRRFVKSEWLPVTFLCQNKIRNEIKNEKSLWVKYITPCKTSQQPFCLFPLPASLHHGAAIFFFADNTTKDTLEILNSPFHVFTLYFQCLLLLPTFCAPFYFEWIWNVQIHWKELKSCSRHICKSNLCNSSVNWHQQRKFLNTRDSAQCNAHNLCMKKYRCA